MRAVISWHAQKVQVNGAYKLAKLKRIKESKTVTMVSFTENSTQNANNSVS